MENKFDFKPYSGAGDSEEDGFRIQDVNARLIYKYLPIRHFLSSFFRNEIYLANPNTWPDPFEQNYQSTVETMKVTSDGVLKEIAEEIKDYYPFATCFASGLENEQASWNAYIKGNTPVIRVAIDYQKFLKALSKCSCGEKEFLYISKMEYKSRNQILTPEPLGMERKENAAEDLYIRNFSLKQDAYKFEGEIRLTLLTKVGEKYKSSRILTGINWKNFIDHITLPPVFGGNDEAVFTLKKVLNMTLDTDIKLYKSTLYEIKNLTEEMI